MKLGKRSKGLLAVLLALVLMVAAGCQAIGGVDFNQMLKNSLKVTSMEGSQSMEFHLLLKDGALDGMDPEEAAIASLFTSIKVELTDIKMKDGQNASLSGILSLGDTHIGFGLQTSPELSVLQLEGMEKPIELKMTGNSLAELLGTANLTAGEPQAALSEDVQAELKAVGRELIDQVGGYAINNLPNPARLTVTPATEAINGESLAMMHVHTEINGKELWQWIGSYVDALIADKEGLTTMLTSVVELFSQHEELWASLGTENPFESIPDGMTTEEFIAQGVEELMGNLTDMRDELKRSEQEDADSLNEFFNENTYIKADFYVDTKLDIRKHDLELVVKPQMASDIESLDAMSSAMSDFEGFSLKLSGESWNINGTVTSEVPKETPGAWKPEDLMMLKEYQLLHLFDSNSDTYDLLKNKLHLGRQTVVLNPYYDDNPPIKTPDGITLIPLRTAASELGATITYVKADKSIRLFDEATATTIQMRSGNKGVIVNGVYTKWSYPVTQLAGGTLYVPAKDLIDTLGGTAAWTRSSDENDDAGNLVLEREIS